MATTNPGKPNEPIILHFEWTAKESRFVDNALAALKVSTDHQLAHCPGVATYAFRRVDDRTIRMTEVYSDAKTFWAHIPSGSYISDKVQFLFNSDVRDHALGVGVGQLTEGIEATVKMMGGHTSPLLAGFALSSSPSTGEAVNPTLLSMLVKSCSEEDSRDFVVSTLAPFIKEAKSHANIRTCAVFCNENDIQVLVISSSELAISDLLASLKQTVLQLKKFDFALEICGDVGSTFQEQLSANGFTIETKKLDAGYLVHPVIISGVAQKKQVQSSPSSIPEPPTSPLFCLVIDQYTEEPTGIRFSAAAPGRSPHQYKNGAPNQTEADGTLEIPLLHIVRKLSGSGGTDVEIPIDKLFGLLERLRSWQRSLRLCNRSFANEILNEEEQYFVETFVENFHNIGYPLRAKDKHVNIEGLPEFIQTIEWAMREIIDGARKSIEAAQQVTYKGLMEAYPIGTTVVGPASGLGGAMVAYRVFDCYMSTQRSIFGARKYVFTIGLEFVVNLGAHFCVCNFEDKIEEFEGERSLSTLPYVPIAFQKHDESELFARGKAVAALGVRPVYRSYASGAFFAHLSGNSSGTPATVGVHQAGPGRCMVDNERGLILGHAPGVSYDGAGIAIQSTMKVYRVAVRASHENESEAVKQDRIKNAKLRLFKNLPGHFEVITWPAVVAYSFTWKTWGHVLTSGLREVQFSDEPWSQLVLPKRTKDLLYASVLFNLSGAPGVGDLIKGKSQGALYLLYGPPGTGKTLTVEAISEKFHLPLYTVSLGELGTTAREVDAAINNILALCAQWKAIVLLDEGDALLEQREKGKLQMNSLTGVLLRSLENFDGQLFITSNRLQHIDHAVLSRVTLAIKYDALDAAARASVWRNTLTRAGVNLQNLDVEALAKYEISGRELLHIVKLGLALAFFKETTLTQELIVAALEESLEFRSHFPTTSY
jgi:hypothetical protein